MADDDGAGRAAPRGWEALSSEGKAGVGQRVDLSDLKRLVEDEVIHVRGIVAVKCFSACASLRFTSANLSKYGSIVCFFAFLRQAK